MIIEKGGDKSMRDLVLETFVFAFTSFYGSITEAVSILTGGLRTGNNASMYKLVTDTNKFVEGVALSFISLLFLVDLIQNTLLKVDELRWEDVIKAMLKLLMAKSIVGYIVFFLEATYSMIGKSILNMSGGINVTDEADKIRELFDNLIPTGGGIIASFQQIAFFCMNILTYIGMMLLGIVVKVMAWGRMLEVYVLLAISPIAMGFCPWSGTSDVPKRFVLSFIGVCLQGLVMIVCCKMYMALPPITTTSGVAATAQLLVNGCVLGYALVNSSKWAKQLVGM